MHVIFKNVWQELQNFLYFLFIHFIAVFFHTLNDFIERFYRNLIYLIFYMVLGCFVFW